MASVPNETTSIDSTPVEYSVAVIGGGIGGLCLAIGLLKYPHINVQVYESAPSFGEIGAGVAVGPNAQRALELLGSGPKEAFQSQATPNLWTSHANSFVDYVVGVGEHEGELITSQKNSTGMQSVHRAKFLDALVKLVPAQRTHFNKRLTTIEDDSEKGGKVTMHFKDGTSETTDAIVGADGVHSHVRTYLLGEEHPAAKAVFSGSVAYRGIVPMDRAIETLGAEFAQNSMMLCGPGRSVLSYPIDHGELLNIVMLDYEVGLWEDKKWIVPTDINNLRDRFKGWGKPAQGMIELLDRPDLATWALYEMPAAPYYNKGRVCMTGDAAHATTPFQGQGAGQAIEDALVLETLLGHTKTKKHIANAFAAYDQTRRSRTQRVVATSNELGEVMGMKFPGIGNDLKKVKENLDTRMHWIWHRNIVAQNIGAVRLLHESL